MTIEEYKARIAKLEDDMIKGVITSKQGASEKRRLETYNSEIAISIKEAEEKSKNS